MEEKIKQFEKVLSQIEYLYNFNTKPDANLTQTFKSLYSELQGILPANLATKANWVIQRAL